MSGVGFRVREIWIWSWFWSSTAERLPIPKHRNLLTLRSGPGTRNGLQIRTSRKIWVDRSKLGVPGHIYSEIEGQWLFVFENGTWRFFLTCQMIRYRNIRRSSPRVLRISKFCHLENSMSLNYCVTISIYKHICAVLQSLQKGMVGNFFKYLNVNNKLEFMSNIPGNLWHIRNLS